MLINDLFELLMKVPPTLAAAWGVWFSVGLMLSIWQRRDQARLVVHGPAPKQKSGVHPPSGGRVAKPVTNVAYTTGDAFSDLEAALEPEQSRGHRRPGDDAPSHLMSEAPRPLAAPQSLP